MTEALKDLDVSSLARRADLEIALAKQSATLIKWVAGTLVAHGAATAALTVALFQLLA